MVRAAGHRLKRIVPTCGRHTGRRYALYLLSRDSFAWAPGDDGGAGRADVRAEAVVGPFDEALLQQGAELYGCGSVVFSQAEAVASLGDGFVEIGEGPCEAVLDNLEVGHDADLGEQVYKIESCRLRLQRHAVELLPKAHVRWKRVDAQVDEDALAGARLKLADEWNRIGDG